MKAHAGDEYNEKADKAAKAGKMADTNTRFCRYYSDRICFALTHRDEIVDENPRSYCKSITQNIMRAAWINHHTSDKLFNASKTNQIDWKMEKKIIHPDGSIRTGYTSRLTADIRSYIIKSITGTLPTMAKLESKWAIYESDKCPNCEEARETDEHLWTCDKTKHQVTDIINQYNAKHNTKTPQATVLLAMQGIAMTRITDDLEQSIRRKAREEKEPKPKQQDITKKVAQAIINLIKEGRKEIWNPRCSRAIELQRKSGITNRNKNPKQSKMKGPTQNQIQTTDDNHTDGLNTPPEQITIPVPGIGEMYDAYRCKCSKHSLIHSPGKNCSNRGLIYNRAIEIMKSNRHTLQKSGKNQRCHYDVMMVSSKRHHNVLLIENAMIMF